MTAIAIKKHHTLTGHKESLYALCAYDESRFFSAGGDGMVVMWDLHAPETGQMIVKVPSSIYAMSYQASKNLLVVGQNFSGIHLVDVEAKKEVGSLAIGQSQIFDIKTTDKYIYVATGAGEVIQTGWDLQIKSRVKLSGKSIRALALDATEKILAAGSSDQWITVFDAEDLNVQKTFEAHSISVFGLRFHPELPVLLSVSRDARFKIWDTDRDFQLVEEVAGHMYAINDLTFAPSGDFFATASMDKTVKIWDAQTFRLLKVIDKARHGGHTTSVNKLLWMPYENWLVSCSDDRTIAVWEVKNNE